MGWVIFSDTTWTQARLCVLTEPVNERERETERREKDEKMNKIIRTSQGKNVNKQNKKDTCTCKSMRYTV